MFSPGPSIRVRPKFVTPGLLRSGVKFHEIKVPEVTLGFWVIKILATTLGGRRRHRHHDLAQG